MRYNDNARLDSGQVAGGGGGAGGRIAVGGGVGTMILLFILSQLFGIDLTGLAGGGQAESRPDSNAYAHCQTGQDIQQNRECRWVAYTNSIQDYWSQAYSGYQMTQTRLFTNQVSTACGTATSAVGPFYCPADSRVYLDETFFDSMLRQLGGQKSDAAEAYVIAHEYGHHIQNLTGVMEQVQRQGQTTGPDSPATRLELQADCYAGVWFKHVVNDPQGPISQVTQEDLNNALDAARIVGDDSIQQRTQGRVNPDAWTHGSSEQRKRWLATGYNTGDPNACNTFASRQV
ncbi:MAG: neutral zinc metallopeptidase [Propionibacteriaceae bacterium]|nr:neutral zinc metallopeptidase [Propionibacteriaceae bacterium]